LLGLSLGERVVYELCILTRTFGRPYEGGVLIDAPVRHADLAELVSGSRANVSRHMGRLQRAGLVRREGRRTIVSTMLIDSHRKGTRCIPRRRGR
jgi:CRP-like cAMP-binding protein